MPTINVEVMSPAERSFQVDDRATWQEEVAPGATLGRLLERLANERPLFRELYDPARRRLAEQVSLTINGRAYHLVGGLTYFLHDGDRIAIGPAEADDAPEGSGARSTTGSGER